MGEDDTARSHIDHSSIVTRYCKRILSPLLHRVDIHVDVPRVNYEKWTREYLAESSARFEST